MVPLLKTHHVNGISMIILLFVHIFWVFIIDIFKDLQDYLLERLINVPVGALIIEHELRMFLEITPTFAGFLELFWTAFYSYPMLIQIS
jgi:4-hydroxybenzoate polyprenyltransferase